ncbi:DoxX family protein [Urechidicola vernalis]|uniref:DoxX family protein n=1 Tax=Urechidicola vernalis TaxID=3075600 RepID=A0ABU2Y837_9FLAO|nr:DoxX family protein [Urechidicola sp. P050]MDT0553965.1 DoxX family protein [Urechidicola sp. P050]
MKLNFYLFLRLIIAALLIQTLYFKFSAHPDSVYIFTKVGMEPYGRIGIGVLELISALLILNKNTIWAGAFLSSGIISGAVLMHLTDLGIEINNDGGRLFYMALLVLLLSLIVLFIERKNIPFLGSKI